MLSYKKKGFTLVELIISIGIVSIIATVGIISYIGYIEGARDANRMSQLDNFRKLLDTYRTINLLPLPENAIEIKDGSGNILAYQGILGEGVMKILEYNGDGVDPLNGDYYTYEITNNRKKFQLLAFLEEGEYVEGDIFQYNSGNLYPYITGDKLGILTTSSGVPINKDASIIIAGGLDITTIADGVLVSFVEQEKGVRQNYSDLVVLLARGGSSFGVVDGILIDYDPSLNR